MTYADFVLAVPAWVRLLLALIITIGITVAVVAALHQRILQLNDEGGDESDDADEGDAKRDADDTADEEELPEADAGPRMPSAPEMYHLSGRIMSITTMGFVFLLAFALGNLWSNHRAAEQATQAEVADLTRVAAAAEFLPPAQRDPILAALETYTATVRDVEWPLMQDGDAVGTAAEHSEAAAALVKAAAAAVAQGAESSPAWSPLSSAIDDALTNGSNRISQVPTGRVLSIVLLVCGLGLANLAMVSAFQPTRLRNNLFLIGVMAAITATLMFVLVEASNPYLGGGAIDPAIYLVSRSS